MVLTMDSSSYFTRSTYFLLGSRPRILQFPFLSDVLTSFNYPPQQASTIPSTPSLLKSLMVPNMLNATFLPSMSTYSWLPPYNARVLLEGSKMYSLRNALTMYSPYSRLLVQNSPCSSVQLLIRLLLFLDMVEMKIRTLGRLFCLSSTTLTLMLLNLSTVTFTLTMLSSLLRD